METIENIEKAVDRLITIVSMQLSALNDVKALLNSEALKGINYKEQLFSTSGGKVIPIDSKFNSELYKDYPMNGKFPEKMDFLDKIHPQAWRLKERRELIKLIEGEDNASKTLAGETGKVQNMIKSGRWLGAKYGGVNKYTFYVKPEWRSEDGKIKEVHSPSSQLLQNLPEEKRKQENIIWLP